MSISGKSRFAGLADAASQLERFCRQYVQLSPELDFPDAECLRDESFQQALFERLFGNTVLHHSPPQRYQLRTLKELTGRIESSITDWETHSISEDLMDSLSSLLSAPVYTEIAFAQQKSLVTYTLSLISSTHDPPTIGLYEARNLVSAAGTTGMRTWEAALHLGNYLCTQGDTLIRGRHILELGSGTGYISVLCAKHLGAAHVLTTDGSEDVVAALSLNFAHNNLQDSARIAATEFKWGHSLIDGEEAGWNRGQSVDVVLGADITYDESCLIQLATTFSDLFQLHPKVKIIISATIRNPKTFDAFIDTCRTFGIQVENVDFGIILAEEQMGPFFADQVPIRIVTISNK